MKSACGIKALDALVTAATPFTGTFGRGSGVAAFDSLVGGLTGRTSDMSMATMCALALDNGLMLFPTGSPWRCSWRSRPRSSCCTSTTSRR